MLTLVLFFPTSYVRQLPSMDCLLTFGSTLCAAFERNCRREAYRLHADTVMITKDIFAYISWKTGWILTKLGRGMGMGCGKRVPCKIFGEIAPEAPEKG